MYLTPHFPSNWLFNPSTRWTREENKQFERALAVFDKETPERWLNIAAMIPGKSVSDVMSKYKELEEDLMEIEAGRIPIPWYLASEGRDSDHDRFRKKGSAAGRGSDQERKKGVPWTEEEHRYLRPASLYSEYSFVYIQTMQTTAHKHIFKRSVCS